MANSRQRRTRALVGVLVVLVLAGIAGTIFYLDFHQARSNDKDKKIEVAKQKAAAGFQLTGRVSAVTPTSMTVKLANGKLRRVGVSGNTRVYTATAGSLDDVKQGLRAVVRKKAGAVRTVQEILVLPAPSRVGQAILGTGFGFVWQSTSDGRTGPKFNMVEATVDTARVTSRTDVVVGAKVIVRAQTTVTKPIVTVATDIVVMPAGTALVS